jgi:hypothetical protein
LQAAVADKLTWRLSTPIQSALDRFHGPKFLRRIQLLGSGMVKDLFFCIPN